MRVQVWACVCMNHGYACRLIPACAYQGFPWPLLSKNKFICSLKIIFSILTFLKVNLTSDWALNQPWVLEFKHHCGMGAPVVRVQNVVPTDAPLLICELC